MAHELEIVNGAAQMAYVGHLPWHGLGVQVEPDIQPIEMMKAAGLDWEVHQLALQARGPNGEIIDTKSTALVRSTDLKVLDTVPETWNPVQNQEAFEFFQEFIDNNDMEMHTAGSLFGGKRVWALAKVKDGFSIKGGDEVESYLLFSNPHQFGRAIDIKFTPIRVVCNNTLSYALSQIDQNQVRISHRREFSADMAKELLGVASNQLAQYKEAAEFLAEKRYTDEQLLEYYKELFPTYSDDKTVVSRQAERAIELTETQPGFEFARGTWWNAFNAVTFITNHEYGRSNDRRLDSLWFGTNSARNRKAITSALEYAQAA